MNLANNVSRAARRLRTLAAILAALALGGCGGDGRVPLFPATGRVLVDGQPAKGVQVRLRPFDRPGDIDALQPFATTGEDGTFRLGTYQDGDGAPAGRYKATLFWPDRPPGTSPPTDLLGGRYDDAAQSGLDVTIAEGTNQIEPFQAEKAPTPSRKPPARPSRPSPDGLDETPPA